METTQTIIMEKYWLAAINLDCVGAAAKNYSNQVHIISETYDQDITIDLNESGAEQLKRLVL